MFGQQTPAQPSPVEMKIAAATAAAATAGTEQQSDGLAAVTVTSRIPEFWMDKPKLWFAHFEATIFGQKLGDAAKQNLVVTKLGKSSIEQVSDIILEPPENNKYDALKARLLQVYEESEARQFQKLLSEMELGSQKPSQLLRRMKELAKGKIVDDSLRMLWISHLPPSVRAVLAVTDINLDGLAVVADKIMETTKPIEIAELRAAGNPSSELAAQVEKLTLEVQAIRRGREGQRYASRRYKTSVSRSRDRTSTDGSRGKSRKSPNWMCFYHFRYGTKASKCVDPCNWEKKTQEN